MPKGIYDRKSKEERFWEKVDTKEEDECWLWNCSLDKDGYGDYSMMKDGKKKTVKAHRFSLMMKLNNFDLPSSVFARHTCDNRKCVNPKHLIEGTAKENSQDMIARNRSLKGEDNKASKITNEIAKKIKEEYQAEVDAGKKYGSHRRIASKYNIDFQIVNRIVCGQTWKHIE